MVIYDAEVLSIPASDQTISQVNKNMIYECPNTPNYNHKKAMFVTFREPKGGMMSALYKIEETLILNASDLKKKLKQEDKILEDMAINEDIRDRITDYISSQESFSEGEKRFYVLSKKEVIDLKEIFNKNKENKGDNRPRPPRNNSYTALK